MSKLVWILDDDQDFCDFIAKWLTKNFKVIVKTYTEIEEFSTKINNSNILPDLILMDIRLKEGNGLEVSKEVHKAFHDIPIIHITGLGGEPIFEDEYTILSKPVDDKMLKNVLHKYI